MTGILSGLIPIVLIALTPEPGATPERPVPPINCTETFDHSDSLEHLVEQLRDDDIRMNLTKALRVLRTHPDLTPGFLYKHLEHPDWQVRQVICNEIWTRGSPLILSEPPDPAYPVTETLVRVTIEGLRHDTTPFDHPRRRGLCYSNATTGMHRLIPIAKEWSEVLMEAMDSDDAQQRILAAVILGHAEHAPAAERAAQILLPHLRDNDISEDAKFCAPALRGFGHAVVPYLLRAIPNADAQQRDLITLIVRHIESPQKSNSERRVIAALNTITQSVHDPVAAPAPTSMLWFSQLYH